VGLSVLMTGANSGIGFHLADALLAAQHRVAVLDVAVDRLVTLHEVHGDRLRFWRCDVTDAKRVQATVDECAAEWGRIDVLINNACLCHFEPFAQRTLEQQRRELEVNYFGYVNTIWAVLPHMRRQGGGLIYNVGAAVGLTGFAGISGYAAAKGAIEALTRSLALELRPEGIHVCLIHPPLTRTASAAPLGVPAEVMADPAVVGRRLARRIGSARPVITPDVRTALFLVMARLFPTAVGRLLTRLTERARQGYRHRKEGGSESLNRK